MKRAAAILFAIALGATHAAIAQSEEVAHPDPAVEARLKVLGEELRCLVCQNQTLADSNAPLAQDLRNEIRGQIAKGKNDDEIRAYLVDRYGDFVLYRPPWKPATLLLWLGPFVLLGAGAWVFTRVVRSRKARSSAEDAGMADQASVEALLSRDD